jgi:two-component system phosphate regulon response regulator PhoB
MHSSPTVGARTVPMAGVETQLPGSAITRRRILLIEDERTLAELLVSYLSRAGYEAIVAHDGQEGLHEAQTVLPDLLLLDLMLPVLDGQSVLRELRAGEKTREIPVIILSARDKETDQVTGFSLGCDDYVTKPFQMKVLLQRINNLLRPRKGRFDSDVIEHLGVRLDPTRHRVFANGRELDLTLTEFRLLECLLRQPGLTFTRQQIMAAILDNYVVSDRTVDAHIKTLRRKLGTTELIETVRGVGYRFKE